MTVLVSVFLVWYGVGLTVSVVQAVRAARRAGGHPAPAALLGVARALPLDVAVLALVGGVAAVAVALS